MITLKESLLALVAALAWTGSAHAQSTAVLTDLGAVEPTPQANDIAQLSTTGNQNAPDNLNYYTDNGVNHTDIGEAGQTFTTGNNAAGYSLTGLAVRSAGLGSLSGIDTAQTYLLHVYSISGSSATLLATYSADNFTFADGDWLQWSGLLVHLNPNSTYAYSMGRTSAGTGWEDFAVASGNTYAGGEIAMIPTAGGTVTTGSSHGFDGTFVINLTLPGSLTVGAPSVSPTGTVYAGSPLTLSVQAEGTAPFHYQWQSDNGSGGATFTPLANSDSATFVTSTTGLDGVTVQYRVKVTDATGSAVSPAVSVALSPASAPVVATDTTPAALTVFTGHNATFTARFQGTLPISSQWQVTSASGVTKIPGATNATLVVTNVTLANAGAYSLAAANTLGTVSGTPAQLTVLTAPSPVTAADKYGTAILTNQPIAYWRLNDVSGSQGAYDFAGSHDAANTSAVFGQPGLRPPDFPGFTSANTAAAFDGTSAYLGTSSSLMNGLTNFTITGWFEPTAPNTDPRTGLFGQNDVVEFGYNDTDGVNIWLPLNGTWVNPKSGNSGFAQGTWAFVAFVGDGTNADLYVNGVLRNRQTGGALSATSTYGFNIGGGGIYDPTGNFFNGQIEDVAVFNKALTAQQIQNLYGLAVGAVAPAATVSPASATRYVGRTARFSATVLSGTAPFTYQWQHDNTNLVDSAAVSGSTSGQLTVSGVTAADVGQYAVTVSNSAGKVTTAPANLSVVSPTTGSSDAAVVSLDPVAYWRLNETTDPSAGTATAADYYGGFDGTYGSAAQNGFNNIFGPLTSDGFSMFGSANHAVQCAAMANSYVVGPALNLNTNRATFTFWLKPTGTQQSYCGLVTTRTPVGAGVNYTSDDQIGYTWNNNNQNTWSFLSGLVPPQDQWSFVAVAIDPAQATFYLINQAGTQTATNVVPHTAEVFGGPTRIGGDPQDDAARTYSGTIDEVAVFNKTLTSEQVQNLYHGVAAQPPVEVKVAFQKTSSGLVLTWANGTLQSADAISGPWTNVSNASSPFTATVTGTAKFYRVQVQ